MVNDAHHPPTILITYLAKLGPDHTRDWKIAYYKGREFEQERDNIYYILYQQRFQLWRSIEKSDNSLHFFQDLMIANDDAIWLKGRHYRTTKKDLEKTLGMARRSETEIRDYMAILVG